MGQEWADAPVDDATVLLKSADILMPKTAKWYSVAYGNGKYVAVANGSSTAAYSTDGVTWVQTTMPASASWQKVAYGNGKYVAVASDSKTAAYSTDGITWVKTTMPASASWRTVVYGKDKFVAVAYSSTTAAYSTDGVTWVQTTMPASANWYVTTYGKGKFVAIAFYSDIAAYSLDGITWVQTTMPASASWRSASYCERSTTYGDERFIAIANDSQTFAYSFNGINWKTLSLPTSAQWYSVTFGNGKFVAIAYNSDIAAYSKDGGLNWVQTALPKTAKWYSVTFGNGRFVAITYNSDITAYSTDGINWISTAPVLQLPNGTDIHGQVKDALQIKMPSASTTAPKAPGTASGGAEDTYARGDHVHPRDDTKLDTMLTNLSAETIIKSTTSITGAPSLVQLAYGNGVYVGVDEECKLYRSTDMHTFSQINGGMIVTGSAGKQYFGCVTFCHDRFFRTYAADGTTERLDYSFDGETWHAGNPVAGVSADAPTNARWSHVLYLSDTNGSVFVALPGPSLDDTKTPTAGTYYLVSTDGGATWKKITSPSIPNSGAWFTSAAYTGDKFCALTSDGIPFFAQGSNFYKSGVDTWGTKLNPLGDLGDRNKHSNVVAKNGWFYVYSATSKTVYKSSNCTAWDRVGDLSSLMDGLEALSNPYLAVFPDKERFVLVGQNQKIGTTATYRTNIYLSEDAAEWAACGVVDQQTVEQLSYTVGDGAQLLFTTMLGSSQRSAYSPLSVVLHSAKDAIAGLGFATDTHITTDTSTKITGLLKGANGKVAQAVPGTDYVIPSALESLQEFYFSMDGTLAEQNLTIRDPGGLGDMAHALNEQILTHGDLIPIETCRPCIIAQGTGDAAESQIVLKYAGVGQDDSLSIFSGIWHNAVNESQYSVSLLYKLGNPGFEQYNIVQLKNIDPSTTTPLAPTEAGSVGTSTAYARGDHSHPSEVFWCTVTNVGTSSYTCDKTYAEIAAAYNAGKICIAKYGGIVFQLANVKPAGSGTKYVIFKSSIASSSTSSGVVVLTITSTNIVTVEDEIVSKLPDATKITLTVAGWDSTAKTQSVTVSGVSADATSQEIRVMPVNAALDSPYIAAGVQCVAQAADGLTFACKTVPTEDIEVYVVIQGVSYSNIV